MTFEVGDIAQWVYHPRDKALIGTLTEITDVAPPGDLWAIFMTGSTTETWYDVIDVHGNERGALHSWLGLPPPVVIRERETELAHEA